MSPQRLVNYRNTWYLDAWCHRRRWPAPLRLGIQDARALDTAHRHVAVKELGGRARRRLRHLSARAASSEVATLVFEADAAQWVAGEEWHPQQKPRWLDDGRYELQVPYSDPTELAMDILRWGDRVVVAGDKALSTRSRRGCAALAQYAVRRGPAPLLLEEPHDLHGLRPAP